MKRRLFEHGLGYAWVAGEVGNMTSFISIFKNRVKDCAIQKMQGFINSSSKALHYRHFKSILNPERYLSMDLPFMLKKSYSNFRCSSHALQIEKSRHDKIDRDYRFCPYCLNRVVFAIEDEFHFILLCPLYDDVRQTFLHDQLENRIVTLQLFYILLSDYNSKNVISIANYISKAFVIRNEYMCDR